MELPVINVSIIVLAVIAIINRIKKEAPELKSYVYTLMAFGVGAAVYAIFIYAPSPIPIIFAIGLAASGIFDIFSKT